MPQLALLSNFSAGPTKMLQLALLSNFSAGPTKPPRRPAARSAEAKRPWGGGGRPFYFESKKIPAVYPLARPNLNFIIKIEDTVCGRPYCIQAELLISVNVCFFHKTTEKEVDK